MASVEQMSVCDAVDTMLISLSCLATCIATTYTPVVSEVAGPSASTTSIQAGKAAIKLAASAASPEGFPSLDHLGR